MKQLIILLSFMLIIPAWLFASGDDDKEAIKQVITSAYVNGLQNKGPVKDIEAGFHPGFDLLGIKNNELTKWPIYSWIQYHEKKLKENPDPPKPEEIVTAQFPLIDITGNAAIVKIELLKGGKHIFTDYLSLYKFEEGWRIVNKIYYRHE
jgi:hypothetical protein